MKFDLYIKHSKRLITTDNKIEWYTIFCNKSYMNVVSFFHNTLMDGTYPSCDDVRI